MNASHSGPSTRTHFSSRLSPETRSMRGGERAHPLEGRDETIAETASTGDDHDLDTMIQRVRAATIAVVNGEPEPWLALCSHRPDATLVGGWGGHERGWEELEPRYVWATARFAGGDVTFEELSRFVSADLAGAVHHERMRARLRGMAEPEPIVLRVPQLYRREESGWRLIHRHADPLIEIQSPESVVKR